MSKYFETIEKTIIFFFILNFISSTSKNEINLINKIEVVVNTKNVYEIPVYRIKNIKESFILLKDLAKIFSSTLTYYSSGGYIAFNYKGEKLYFYLSRNYIIYKKSKIYLSSEILMVSGRTYVPSTIFNSQEFANILQTEIQFNKESNLLIVNKYDNIQIIPYVREDYARISFILTQQILNEYRLEDGTINIIFFDAQITPRENNIENGIVQKISVKQQNGNALVKLVLRSIGDVDIKKEQIKDTVIFEIKGNKNKFDNVGKVEEKKEIETQDKSLNATTKEKQDNIKNTELKENLTIITPKLISDKITIILDPGHGGEDSGVIGPSGTLEKNINLTIAKYLRDMLKKDGFNVLLTRQEDIFVPLVERTRFANENKGDIFVSLHCNSADNNREIQTGFEIYYLSEKATDPDALATEKLENEVVKFENLTVEQQKLKIILSSIDMNINMNKSSKLSGYILREVVNKTNLPNRKVKQASFYVLRGAAMPAVLVECGFLSNPNEERKLIKTEFQLLIVNGIYEGIKKYVFEEW